MTSRESPFMGLTTLIGSTICALPSADQLRFVLAYLSTVREGGFRDVVEQLLASPTPVLIAAADALDAAAVAARQVERAGTELLVDQAVARILADG